MAAWTCINGELTWDGPEVPLVFGAAGTTSFRVYVSLHSTLKIQRSDALSSPTFNINHGEISTDLSDYYKEQTGLQLGSVSTTQANELAAGIRSGNVTIMASTGSIFKANEIVGQPIIKFEFSTDEVPLDDCSYTKKMDYFYSVRKMKV